MRPIVIQTLWMRIRAKPPPPAELEAYCDRLLEILAAGGRIKLVQIHTIARKPAEEWVAALGNAEVDAIAERVRHRTGLPVAAFYGGGERGEGREEKGQIGQTLNCFCPLLSPLSSPSTTSDAEFWPGCDAFCGRSSAGPFRSSLVPTSDSVQA